MRTPPESPKKAEIEELRDELQHEHDRTSGRERTSRTTSAASSAIATWPPGTPSAIC